MSKLIEKIEESNLPMTMRDILVMNILQFSSTDDLVSEIENRMLGLDTNPDLNSINNSAIIEEVTCRVQSIAILIASATTLNNIGKDVSKLSKINFDKSMTSHVTASL
jgi:hypothetical protein